MIKFFGFLIMGLSLVVLLVYTLVRHPHAVPLVLIERQIVYLPALGQSRREVWQALSETGATEGRRLHSIGAHSEEGGEVDRILQERERKQ